MTQSGGGGGGGLSFLSPSSSAGPGLSCETNKVDLAVFRLVKRCLVARSSVIQEVYFCSSLLENNNSCTSYALAVCSVNRPIENVCCPRRVFSWR